MSKVSISGTIKLMREFNIKGVTDNDGSAYLYENLLGRRLFPLVAKHITSLGNIRVIVAEDETRNFILIEYANGEKK